MFPNDTAPRSAVRPCVPDQHVFIGHRAQNGRGGVWMSGGNGRHRSRCAHTPAAPLRQAWDQTIGTRPYHSPPPRPPVTAVTATARPLRGLSTHVRRCRRRRRRPPSSLFSAVRSADGHYEVVVVVNTCSVREHAVFVGSLFC